MNIFIKIIKKIDFINIYEYVFVKIFRIIGMIVIKVIRILKIIIIII